MSQQPDWVGRDLDTGSSRGLLDEKASHQTPEAENFLSNEDLGESVAGAIDEFSEDPEVGVLRLHREPVTLDPLVAQLRAERLRRRKREFSRSGRWTQKDVARRLGTHQSTISEWESGLILPPLPRLRAWAALFDLTPVLVNSAGELAA